MTGWEQLESPPERRARWATRGAGALATLAAVGALLSRTAPPRFEGASLAGGHHHHRDGGARASEDNSWDDVASIVNVTKMTWAASDPVAARRWFREYLPVQKARDGCTPFCECGTQGRVELNGSVIGYQGMFGLHTVDSFEKPSGPLSLSQIEAVFDAKLSDMAGKYADVMDFHVGLFALNLDKWLAKFAADGLAWHAVAWTSADGRSMLSVLVRVTGTVIVELCSEHQSYFDTAALPQAPRRFGGNIGDVEPPMAKDLVPLWVSRASANVTRDAAFYADVLGATEVWAHNDTASGGAAMRYLALDTDTLTFEIHFVERAPDATGGFTIADLEGYYRQVHAATVLSPYCGFDTWFDNHIGIDHCGGEQCPLLRNNQAQRATAFDGVLRKVRERPAEHPATYRLWRQEYVNMTGRWIYNAYVVEPSGQVLQLNGFLMDAPDAPVWNISLCGQGNCSLVS